MRFTIVIPLYNKAKYIARTLSSIEAQSYSDFEIVVVDDGSTDNSAKIVETFPSQRIRLIRQENRGESGARNTGIEESRGEYVAFIDADDEWEQDHLENLMELIKAFPRAGLYCTGYRFVEPDDQVKYPNWVNVPKRGILRRYFHSVAKGDQVATSSSACVPIAVFKAIGTFSVGDRLGADQDMWARIALRYEVAVQSKATATYYRNASDRVCLNEKADGELPYSVRLQDHLRESSSSISDITKNDVQDYINKGLLTIVSLQIRAGNRAAAKKMLLDLRIRKSAKALVWRILAMLPPVVSKSVLSSASAIGDSATKIRR